ncbi:hypothetical protein QBK99_13250 [Corticibacterium sp. UT-5YL-CI-8]|nr:hypothetical protein [Tianweitania sp. UT-5YL-CI-8]
MRNLTISIADDLMQETERKAAETGKTASQYVADLFKKPGRFDVLSVFRQVDILRFRLHAIGCS